MSKMVRSKRKWVCTNCSADQIVWEGKCRQCSEIGTLQEEILVEPKPRASKEQKSIIRRSKNAERTAASRMVAIDGRDPQYDKIATSTGRVGHITNMQFDAISKTYVTEVKNRQLPGWLVKAWIQIQQRAIDFNRNALLYLDPPNAPKEFPLHAVKHKNDAMAVIRQDRHEELIAKEKLVQMADEILVSDTNDTRMLYELRALFDRLKM